MYAVNTCFFIRSSSAASSRVEPASVSIARNYLSTVSLMMRHAKSRPSHEDYSSGDRWKERLAQLDTNRGRAHESLMDQIEITERIARWYFDKNIDVENISSKKVRERLEDLDYERIELPRNFFTPKNPPLSRERRELYRHLAESLTEAFINTETLEKSLEEATE